MVAVVARKGLNQLPGCLLMAKERFSSIKRSVFIICTSVFIMLAPSGASSEQPGGQDQNGNNWRVGPRIGLSGYTGLIGFEVQRRHFAFAAGFPGNVGLKYYIMPEGHSWFAGGHFVHFKTNTSDFKYSGYGGRTVWTEYGLGGGHRWRWGTGWDLSLSAGVAYIKEEEFSGPKKRITKSIGIRPGVTVGYSF